MSAIKELIAKNRDRNKVDSFNPLVGETKGRKKLVIPDFHIPEQYVPKEMLNVELIQKIVRLGSIQKFAQEEFGKCSPEIIYAISQQIIKIRIRYDFCFWAVMFVSIKNKTGGEDIPFALNRPQRKLLFVFESQRTSNKPIRVILLKARQWGGSTLVQIYMAWIQLVHKRNWNSIIVAHLKDTSSEIKGMYTKLLENYPSWLLDSDKPVQFSPFERSSSISIIEQTGCKVKLGSAETPDSARGGDSSMAHMTEVAFWKKTLGKEPEDIIRSVCGGIPVLPYTLQVYESTANGTGNFFHKEWQRAKKGESDKEPLFIPWFEIEMYSTPVSDEESFARDLLARKDTDLLYDWFLWEKGATFQNIAWYRQKRKEYSRHEDMMAEYPSDDIEAFQHSGFKVFDPYQIEAIKKNCTDPTEVGELVADGVKKEQTLKNIRFNRESGGFLKVWEHPDETPISDRYVVVVDVGGRSRKADYSVIAVFDRYWMAYGGLPEVVAQWRGHIDHDLLAWKSAQIARYYKNALLVIESNTLETDDSDGDHTEYILDEISQHYSNLYARTPSDSIRSGAPTKWGFHTNRSTKSLILNSMIEIVRENQYTEKEKEACHEMANYEKKPNGSFGAIDGEHDDILMTRMIGLYICFDLPLPKERQPAAVKHRKFISEATL